MTTAAFLVDTAGTLVFFNEAAGELLGVSFEEAGPMEPQDWGSRFSPTGLDGQPLALEELPLSIALNEGRPAHGALCIQSAKGAERVIEVSAFPIIGRAGQSGAMAIFWETPH
jgi:PAS domain-containing protein